jgi:hypothetical protein
MRHHPRISMTESRWRKILLAHIVPLVLVLRLWGDRWPNAMCAVAVLVVANLARLYTTTWVKKGPHELEN